VLIHLTLLVKTKECGNMISAIEDQAETRAEAVFELLEITKNVLFPLVGESLGLSVVSGQSMNSGFDQDESVL